MENKDIIKKLSSCERESSGSSGDERKAKGGETNLLIYPGEREMTHQDKQRMTHRIPHAQTILLRTFPHDDIMTSQPFTLKLHQ